MKRHLQIAALCAAALLSTGASSPTPPASAWEIGPVIKSRSYSVGMPSSPTQAARGWSFEFPYPEPEVGHVHAVTFRHGSLAGKSRIVMRYRINASRGVRFAPQEAPNLAPRISLFFQRAGDNWSARGRYQYYRWYAPALSMREVTQGTYEIAVGLEDPAWISVLGQSAESNRAAFWDAQENADRVGVLFGSDAGRGHGVYATGPAQFTMIDFRVE